MVLKGKIAIVTGASMGIGKSISIALAREGASVLLAARTVEKLEETKREIDSFNGSSIIVRTDLSDKAQILKLFEKAKLEFGRLDILVNNAAITVTGKLVDFDPEDFDRIIDINLKAVYLCCQEALKIMVPQKNGVIINISSNVVYKGYPEQSIYSASKCGVLGITRSIANEHQQDGISVAIIHPGAVDTELAAQARPDIDRSLLIRPEDIADTILYLLNLSGNAWVDEIIVRRRSAKPF
jgi:3-oxoacyl-[acyl-carrier protein] reductase